MAAEGTEITGDRATMRVNMIYSFEDIDTEYVKTSRMNAVKTPEGWRVERDRPSAGALAPWEYRRYKARASPHFLALAPANLKVGSLMTDLEKGRARMKRGLPGVKAPAKLLVIVTRNSKDTKALTKDYRTLSVAGRRRRGAGGDRRAGAEGLGRLRPARVHPLALLRQPQRRPAPDT